jgi:hypothetical protein
MFKGIQIIIGAAVAAAMVCGAHAATTKKATLDAFAVWTSNAQIVQTANRQVSLTGTLGGPLFVETGDGPAEVGNVACPAKIDVSLDSGNEKGAGNCTFVGDGGSKAFGDWTCTGNIENGCAGAFTFSGGTGALANVKGGSDILFLSHSHDFSEAASGSVADKTEGITIWPELQLEIRQALARKK